MRYKRKIFLTVFMIFTIDIMFIETSYGMKSGKERYTSKDMEEAPARKRGRKGYKPLMEPKMNPPTDSFSRYTQPQGVLKYDPKENMYYYGKSLDELARRGKLKTAVPIREDSHGVVYRLKVDKSEQKPAQAKKQSGEVSSEKKKAPLGEKRKYTKEIILETVDSSSETVTLFTGKPLYDERRKMWYHNNDSERTILHINEKGEVIRSEKKQGAAPEGSRATSIGTRFLNVLRNFIGI